MNKKNKELLLLINRLKEKLKHYGLRHKSTVGKDVYIFRVSEIYAVKYVKGKSNICPPVEASLFSKAIAKEIWDNAKFTRGDGQPIIPIGAVLAETFFSEMITDAQSTIEIMEQTLATLESEGK